MYNPDHAREKIVTLKNERNLTDVYIADTADINVSTLRSFLRGVAKDLNVANALAISKALNISLEEINW